MIIPQTDGNDSSGFVSVFNHLEVVGRSRRLGKGKLDHGAMLYLVV
jgi:hypothetical protein